jgi:hypothetical protein
MLVAAADQWAKAMPGQAGADLPALRDQAGGHLPAPQILRHCLPVQPGRRDTGDPSQRGRCAEAGGLAGLVGEVPSEEQGRPREVLCSASRDAEAARRLSGERRRIAARVPSRPRSQRSSSSRRRASTPCSGQSTRRSRPPSDASRASTSSGLKVRGPLRPESIAENLRRRRAMRELDLDTPAVMRIPSELIGLGIDLPVELAVLGLVAW